MEASLGLEDGQVPTVWRRLQRLERMKDSVDFCSLRILRSLQVRFSGVKVGCKGVYSPIHHLLEVTSPHLLRSSSDDALVLPSQGAMILETTKPSCFKPASVGQSDCPRRTLRDVSFLPSLLAIYQWA